MRRDMKNYCIFLFVMGLATIASAIIVLVAPNADAQNGSVTNPDYQLVCPDGWFQQTHGTRTGQCYRLYRIYDDDTKIRVRP